MTTLLNSGYTMQPTPSANKKAYMKPAFSFVSADTMTDMHEDCFGCGRFFLHPTVKPPTAR